MKTPSPAIVPGRPGLAASLIFALATSGTGQEPPKSTTTPAKPKRVVKTDAEWRKLFTPQQYQMTRHAHDRARLHRASSCNNKAKGMYECVCCGTELFSSKTKFDSGTGWPSFYAPYEPAEHQHPPRLQADGYARYRGHVQHLRRPPRPRLRRRTRPDRPPLLHELRWRSSSSRTPRPPRKATDKTDQEDGKDRREGGKDREGRREDGEGRDRRTAPVTETPK